MAVEVDVRLAGNEPADTAGSEGNAAGRGGPFGWMQRLGPPRLASRIIIINLAGLLILVGGLLYFNKSRDDLVDARTKILMTQARLMAAAVAASATADTGQVLIDAEKLAEPDVRETTPPPLDSFRGTDFLIKPDQAGQVLRRLASSTGTRARIYDRDGSLVVDSRYYYSRTGILQLDLPPISEGEHNLVSRAWRSTEDLLFSTSHPPYKDFGLDNGKEFPEIVASLNGASVSAVRANARSEIIISVAVPIQRFRAVLGSLVVTSEGGEINEVLRNERRVVFLTFLVAALAAVLLSLSLAGYIAEPIRRLASAAERVRKGVNNRVEIPDFTSRRDEVGHLSGALRDMTSALYNRIDAIETFAADVAHELKNPLTSLRGAVETLKYAKSDEQKARLIAIATDDVKRLNRLISDISDASRLDAELARAQAGPVDMADLVETLAAIAAETRRQGRAEVRLEIAGTSSGRRRSWFYTINGHDTRLGQVVRNLIDNAVSFAPTDGWVKLTLSRTPRHVVLVIDDNGPGINPDNLDRIFERFYTDRPEVSFGKNSGLGLSISKQIVEAHGGTIRAENRMESGEDGTSAVAGARFTVRLPALNAASKR